jgi:amidase
VKFIAATFVVGVSSAFLCVSNVAQAFEVEEATIAGIHRAFKDKSLTCRALVQTYLDRIHAYDHKGPSLNSILALNPNALAEADERDAQYARAGVTGPLHCVPLLLKDNYNTADMPTTGGSAALAGAQPQADAFVVAKLPGQKLCG